MTSQAIFFIFAQRLRLVTVPKIRGLGFILWTYVTNMYLVIRVSETKRNSIESEWYNADNAFEEELIGQFNSIGFCCKKENGNSCGCPETKIEYAHSNKTKLFSLMKTSPWIPGIAVKGVTKTWTKVSAVPWFVNCLVFFYNLFMKLYRYIKALSRVPFRLKSMCKHFSISWAPEPFRQLKFYWCSWHRQN